MCVSGCIKVNLLVEACRVAPCESLSCCGIFEDLQDIEVESPKDNQPKTENCLCERERKKN